MSLDKRCVRATVAVCGSAFAAVSVAIFVLGGQSINNDIFTILGINQTIFLVMIICGCFLMVTAAIGVTAAYSKNHCLAFIYGFMAMSIMLIFIAMAIAILIMRNTMNDELTRNCHTKAGLSYQIDQIYERGSKVLCTSQCPCNADKSKWPAAQQAKMVTDQFGGESEYTDCPTDTLSQYLELQYNKNSFFQLKIAQLQFKVEKVKQKRSLFKLILQRISSMVYQQFFIIIYEKYILMKMIISLGLSPSKSTYKQSYSCVPLSRQIKL